MNVVTFNDEFVRAIAVRPESRTIARNPAKPRELSEKEKIQRRQTLIERWCANFFCVPVIIVCGLCSLAAFATGSYLAYVVFATM